MGRPQGSKNKTAGIAELLRALPKDVRAKANSISEKTGLPVLIVVVDAMREGLTCVEVDLYDSLIRGRARAGKIVKEADLSGERPLSEHPLYAVNDPDEVTDEQPDEIDQAEGPGSGEEPESIDYMGAELLYGADAERSGDAPVRRGRPPEVVAHPRRTEGERVQPDVEKEDNGDTASSLVHEAAKYDTSYSPDDDI
jgi:hypothetical protein